MVTDKDIEQDFKIRENEARITRNEEAIKRQTAALEQIRDHYYPTKSWSKKALHFVSKVVCVIVAYLGIAEAVDWLWNSHQSQELAEQYAAVAKQLYFEEGNDKGATACYERCNELSGNDPKYRISLAFMRGHALGVVLFGQDRPLTDEERERVDGVLAEATVLKNLDPKNAMPHVLMAQALALRGETDASIAAIERAVALEPENASVRVSSCCMRFFAGFPKEARVQLEEAERLDPTLPQSFIWKGMLALTLDHDVRTARKAFETLTKRTPRQAVGYALLGRAFLEGETPDVTAARTAFRRAVILNARQLLALVGMAETYEREGNLPVARLWLDRALSVDATCMSALVARARVKGKDGDHGEAVADLTAAIALAPFRADLYRLRAEAREKAGDAVRAASDRKTAAALPRQDALETERGLSSRH